LVVPVDGQTTPYWAAAQDLSTRGVFVHTRKQPAIDEVLLLKIVPGGESPEMRVKVKVVHRIAGVGFGCQFVEMTPRASRALSNLVASAVAAPKQQRTLQ
jgi:hypothetical protein